jgi:hypothetical protein
MNEIVTKTDLVLALENMTNRLTIRFGCMVMVGIAALAVLQLIHGRCADPVWSLVARFIQIAG